MDYLIPILFLTYFTWISASEPLTDMMAWRRNGYPVYARDFMANYEPYAVATIPIHTQVPILQVLSPSMYLPGSFKKHPKKPQKVKDHLTYPSNIDQSFEPYNYNYIFEDHSTFPKKEQYNSEAAPVIIYARPNKNGGYTYRRPTRSSTKTQKDNEPIIIRIHKYRVIH